ncbi:response regulator transcription factor [Paraburkholderia sediminicola]|uniref:response regulator transcription factor n=1 Tax=Paraburkholderia sediminicola TaxID=458836 RepID=UPI000E72AF1F
MLIASLEDDPGQATRIRQLLERDGHECRSYTLGAALLRDLRQETFDLLLIDWLLPDISGYDVLGWVRTHLSFDLPVLFLTARSLEEDIVAALRAGADDYLIKPFRSAELSARVEALLRRVRGRMREGQSFSVGVFHIDPERKVIECAGVQVPLTGREFDLALLFFRNVGRMVSRQYIADVIWGRELDAMSRTIDTHVSRLRAKLGRHAVHGVRLRTVYAHGWRLEELPVFDGGGRVGDDRWVAV